MVGMVGEDARIATVLAPPGFVVVSKSILSGSGLTPWPAQPMDVIAPAARNRHIGSVMICVLCCCVYVLRIFWTYWCFMFASGFFGFFNLTTSQWAAWVGLITQNGERTLTSASIWLGSVLSIPVLLGSNSTQQRTNTSFFIDICALWCVMKGPLLLFLGARFHIYRKDLNFRFLTLSFQPHVYVKWWFYIFVVSWLQWSTTKSVMLFT